MNILSNRFTQHIATATSVAVFTSASSLSFSQTDAESVDADSIQVVKTQLQQIPYPLTVQYTETETSWDDDESTKTVAILNAKEDPYWELKSVNDKKPTKKQTKKFKKKVKKQIEDREKDPLESILNLSTLELLETKDDMSIYSFNPLFSAFNEEASTLMTGKILVNLDNKITRIEIDSPVEFSPMFSVKVKNFMINYNVSYHEQTPYITDYELDIYIKIGGFKTIALKADAIYNDIQW